MHSAKSKSALFATMLTEETAVMSALPYSYSDMKHDVGVIYVTLNALMNMRCGSYMID